MPNILRKGKGRQAWQVNIRLHERVMDTIYTPSNITDDIEVEMMQHLVTSSKAEGTIKTYLPVIKEWKNFAASREFQTKPETTEGLSRFIARKCLEGKPLSFFNNLAPALAYNHEANGFPGTPTVHSNFIKTLLAGAKRKAAHDRSPTKKADSLTQKQIHKILNAVFYKPGPPNWIEWRTAMKIFVMYKSFCRWDCYSQLTKDSIIITSEYVSITFDHAKNDQFYNGSQTYLSAIPNSKFCPVKIFKRFFSLFNFKPDTVAYLNCRIRTVRKVSSALQDKQLSYTTSLENSKALLLHLDIQGNFSEKSFKVAGVSEAANQHVPLEDISTFGRWKNLETPLYYMNKSKKRRMEVSKAVV